MTRWCDHYGVELETRPRPAGTHVELDPKGLRHLYVDEGWTATQIGGHLGVDTNLITFALHSHRIPVRHPGNRGQAGDVVILDVLYADPDVVDTLTRYHIPLRRRGGRLGRRFPHPAPLDPALADELYRHIGLSTTHISLLTGHTPRNVLEALRHRGIPTRSGSRSPWYKRTII